MWVRIDRAELARLRGLEDRLRSEQRLVAHLRGRALSTEWFDSVESRLAEIAVAGEQMAAALARCADALETFVEYVIHPGPDEEPPKWPRLVVVEKVGGPGE